MNHNDQPYNSSSLSPNGEGREKTISAIARDPQAKTQKLVTALYIVTDCMEADEPIRKKLRALAVELLSDVRFLTLVDKVDKGEIKPIITEITHRLSEILAFLEIAVTLTLVSQMNFNVLKEEFENFNKRINEKSGTIDILFNKEFFKEDGIETLPAFPQEIEDKGHYQGHNVFDKKDVLDKKTPLSFPPNSFTSYSNPNGTRTPSLPKNKRGLNSREFTKAEGFIRKEKILKFIKQKKETCPEGAKKFRGTTIKDISKVIKGCSEKTIQRDLMSLIKKGVLKKVGEKRWSKYVLQ